MKNHNYRYTNIASRLAMSLKDYCIKIHVLPFHDALIFLFR